MVLESNSSGIIHKVKPSHPLVLSQITLEAQARSPPAFTQKSMHGMKLCTHNNNVKPLTWFSVVIVFKGSLSNTNHAIGIAF